MMVETIVEHGSYVSLFNEAVEEGERTRIYSLGHQKAIDTVKTLSKQDPEKCSAIMGICHYANTVLNENNGHLSTWLIARIIKYLIYRAKIERLEVQTDLDREIDEEYRAIPNIAGSTSSQNTTGFRKAHNDEVEYAFNGKVNARSHVDDVPFEGPNLYVVLSGFHDPNLPAELLSIGVPLVCILEIKLPGERYVDMYHETREKDFISHDKTRFHEGYRIDVKKLDEFWAITRERFANLSAYPIYSDIAVLTFPPAALPETFNITKREFLKRDIRDRALRTLHHLYDLCRQHAKYLKSTKLERGIVDERDGTMDTRIYEDALSDIPNEYINVPLILGAILLQVESNVAKSYDGCVPVKCNAGFSDADARRANTSTTDERIPVFAVRDRLRMLDLQYELIDEYADNTSQSLLPSDLQVIPYGDTLTMIVRPFLDRKIDLDDAVLRVLRDPRIINAWQNHETLTKSKSDTYSCHIDNIARIFDREQRVSREEAAHYLHLLVFDKLIFSEDNYSARTELTQPLKEDLSELKHARSMIRRTRSASNFTSLSSINVSSLRRFKSDTEIDYDKPITAFTECPLLFALIDTRETLLPGYLHENVFKRRKYERSSLEEYEDVELLSSRVFLQVIYECFQQFDRFAERYFEPTDSMLFYFSNDNRVGDVFEETRISSIRTPIGLREFCEYIAKEEENWIERERETRQSRRVDLTGRFMKRPIEVEDDAIIFADECFVLPDSLKARRILKKSPDRDLREKICETKGSEEATGVDVEGKKITGQKLNGTVTTDNGSKQADGRVMSGKTSSMKKKSSANRTDDVDTSSLTVKKILSSRSVEKDGMRDFVDGYDLGSRLRVQVIHHGKKFLLDDQTVRVELENWLHGSSHIRIAITLQHCTLRLCSGVGRPPSEDTFRLTTDGGIILGFCRNKERDFAQSSFDYHWRNLAFDFRASWPSGLLIEPAIGDGTKDPLCIRQSYVSKRLGRASAAHEVCRNFLRNGTVLKYMDDNTVIVLRPNSVIVTCMDFDKSQSYDESIHQTILKEFWKKKSNSVAARSGEKVIGSTESRSNGSIMDEQPSKQHILEKRTTSGDVSLITGTGKALRYSVVNYDGRHYEVLNDLVVSEHDRLLVRTASDYEVNEVFTRRADGTDMLLRSNGELMVTFPDGTRIITGYAVEEQPVICEWSENELQRYFRYDGRINVASSTESAFSPAQYVDYRDKLTGVSIADGFVSILLTFRVEHVDYATVSYDQSAVGYTLSMPDNLCVSISGEGHYEVSMGDKVNLKIRSDKWMGYDETELPRSTYSFPYNWLFPFGKRDQRVSERIQSEVLARRNEQPLPKLLRVRIFFGIKEADRNALIDMQRAMGRYWISVFRDGDKCRLFCATGGGRPCEVENDYGSSERGLRELALGVKGSIDVETYVRSLRGKLIKVSTKAPRQSSRLAELLLQRGSMKEEYKWYKQCMRKRIIVPYFRNIAGSCYSLIKNRVDDEISGKSCSHVDEEDELIGSNGTAENYQNVSIKV